MIQANELRIGNWFIVNWSNEKRKADWMDIRDISEGIIEGGTSPIPLTLEVLEKCGFEVSNIGNHIFYKNGVIIFFENGKWGISCDSRCSLNYLHQLQNLYFALTGEELNYTP